MSSVPKIATFVAGRGAQSVDLNTISAALTFRATPPQAFIYPSGAQSLTSGSWAAVACAFEVFDDVPAGNAPSHDAFTDTSRIYCRVPGKHMISGQVQIATSAGGLRAAQIRMNAAGNVASGVPVANQQQSPVAGGSTSVGLTPVVWSMAEGDYVELFGFQSSGGTVATVSGYANTWLRLQWVSE